MATKRSADAVEGSETNGRTKRVATISNGSRERFGHGLFDPSTVQKYTSSYAASEPYKHAVVSNLIDDGLLRSVRNEIVDNIHFTPKETDIYKIHQSGDLANLDGLDPTALAKLPSLLKLRDALYGAEFRQWVQEVSGAGALSGKKTDMAVNVYVPGCHLLCHDDVIGSRRVSYILYLTDPDRPWKAEWGGALRLYATEEKKGPNGKTFKVPESSWSKVIPPAWNQLSFFAVQPGESFHDVEEVYRGEEKANEEPQSVQANEDDGGRTRMAISGWFHIPQKGEDGFKPGLEEELAKESSLQQLQGKADALDEPQPIWLDPQTKPGVEWTNGNTKIAKHDPDLREEEFDFLLKYMTPNYLTPDTVEELNTLFNDESTLQLTGFLNEKFASRLRMQFGTPAGLIDESKLSTSRPPYKHRYQYLQASTTAPDTESPYESLINRFLPSLPFRKWLAMATGLSLDRTSVLARRFRRGLDYQLAQTYESEDPQLEYTLCITPTPGWGADNDDFDDADSDLVERDNDVTARNGKGNSKKASVGAERIQKQETNGEAQEVGGDQENVGGYELYMAGDEPTESDVESDDGVAIPTSITQSHTGAGDRRSARARRATADPAVYQATADDDDDDGILFSNPAAWNTMSIVLRDQGTMRFVKYVSKAAKGDRWDFTGVYEVTEEED
ncbi:putative component of NuA3 histone acetyltransferase complex [Elasticomyces elasticus]|nr:putative component of NuA3 histone acetyltransferase complex [Elasticomyces elasticus]KAK3636768.1 putative component of NuA3 histone acetyltransferase complex [Elasticomyces elasticus]KAK4912368.1 putative component of NuA3 histone acetyltransferase complex [Elasticomyces elasticus]KAK5751837.1 putative component of NuA3 histone acetyltransferase complex [Elasticomyces elasticus]